MTHEDFEKEFEEWWDNSEWAFLGKLSTYSAMKCSYLAACEPRKKLEEEIARLRAGIEKHKEETYRDMRGGFIERPDAHLYALINVEGGKE